MKYFQVLIRRQAVVASGFILLAFSLLGIQPLVEAMPKNWRVLSGTVRIQQEDEHSLVIYVDSPTAVIFYESFDLQPFEKVRFVLSASDAHVLNRIRGERETYVGGNVTSNQGFVTLSNSTGLQFGLTAQVAMANFFATTLTVDTPNLVEGQQIGKYTFKFEPGTPIGGVVLNYGNVQVQNIGAFIAPNVKDRGRFLSRNGSTSRVSGSVVYATIKPDGGVQFIVGQ